MMCLWIYREMVIVALQKTEQLKLSRKQPKTGLFPQTIRRCGMAANPVPANLMDTKHIQP